MVEAAGKLTGRAGVCLVTRGPGATHASIAVHTAYQDGTPMILVVGQVARQHLGRQAFQEMDFSRVFGGSAKAVVTVMEADRIPEHVARAVHLAHSGRPGPVVLVTPEDVLAELTETRVQVAPTYATPDLAWSDRQLLIDRLQRARFPLIIVGGPGWTQEIGEGVRTFAERNDVPVVSAFRWQDAVSNASRAYVGYLGLGCDPKLRARVEESDLIVGFGPRLDDPTTDGYRLLEWPGRLLLISQDPEEPCRSAIPGRAICEHSRPLQRSVTMVEFAPR
jgi:acetolactate synthase I/II/III large subunit